MPAGSKNFACYVDQSKLLDHKEKMEKFISFGITFIMGSGSGWILSGKHWDIFFTSYVPALATLLAAFYGAKFAFQFQSEKEEKINREKDILNGNVAIFYLMLMANKLLVYRKQFIEPFRGDLTAFLAMPPSLDLQEDNINFDVGKLFFLLNSDETNLIGELAVEKNRFQGSLDAINDRSRLHRYEVQPIFEKAGFVKGGDYTFQQIEEILGERLHNTIKLSTDQVITCVDETINSLQSAGNKLSDILKRMFPGERIISFKFEE